MSRRNSILGELKGKIELLLKEVLPRIEDKIDKIERGLNNHLKSHEKIDEKSSDRWFKIITIIFQVALSAMVTYLLLKK